MPTDTDATTTFDVLAEEECTALLSARSIGRFAIAIAGAAPLVVPVNYVLDHGVIVFRSDPGEKIRALHRQAISFQVDEIDPIHRSGWSVLVKGTAYEASHWEVDHLSLEPWAPGAKQHWVRIVPSSITGRRIQPAPFVPDPRAYL